MISTIGGLFDLNHLDQSSGANDVIVVQHRDGSLHSTPFNVRFGRAKIWNSANKVVQVEVNGVRTSAVMQIGKGGNAYWLQPTYPHSGPSTGSTATSGSAPISPSSPLQRDGQGHLGGYSAAPASLVPEEHHPAVPPADGIKHCTDVAPSPLTPDHVRRTGNENGAVDTACATVTNASITHIVASGVVNPDVCEYPVTYVQVERCTFGTPFASDQRRTDFPSPPSADAVGSSARDSLSVSTGAPPLLLEKDDGHLTVVSSAIQTATDIEEAKLAIQAVEAAERAERRLIRRKLSNDIFLPRASDGEPVSGDSDLHQSPYHVSKRSHAGKLLTYSDDKAVWHTTGSPVDTTPTEAVHHTLSASPQALQKKGNLPTRTDEGEEANSQHLIHSGDDSSCNVDDDEYFLDPIDMDDMVEENDAAGCVEKTPLRNSISSDTLRDTIDGPPLQERALRTAVPHPPTDGSRLDDSPASPSSVPNGKAYFIPTLIPVGTDLLKLNLKPGCNYVRYLAQKQYGEDPVVVTCNIFLWDYRDRLVVSDIDGTITKSDLWGHFYAMMGKGTEWTHAGICSLYSKIVANGYRMVYLTARSVSQIEQTKKYLWTVEQDGVRLPLGPVLTAPQRFFTALTLEVSKQSHVFKIACLSSVLAAFAPIRSKPFFAGFGNRYNDVISYDAVHIPAHKIFIIDPSSVLHVCKVKQTYRNLAHLVDVTFPPCQHHSRRGFTHDGQRPGAALQGSGSDAESASCCSDGYDDGGSNGSDDETSGGACNEIHSAAFVMQRNDIVSIASATVQGILLPAFNTPNNSTGSGFASRSATGGSVQHSVPHPPSNAYAAGHVEEDVPLDEDYGSYNYWRIDPVDLIAPALRGSSSPTATKLQSIAPPLARKQSPAPKLDKREKTSARGVISPVDDVSHPAHDMVVLSTESTSGAGASILREGDTVSTCLPPADASLSRLTVEATTPIPIVSVRSSRFFPFSFTRSRAQPSTQGGTQTEAATLARMRMKSNQHPDYMNYTYLLPLSSDPPKDVGNTTIVQGKLLSSTNIPLTKPISPTPGWVFWKKDSPLRGEQSRNDLLAEKGSTPPSATSLKAPNRTPEPHPMV